MLHDYYHGLLDEFLRLHQAVLAQRQRLDSAGIALNRHIQTKEGRRLPRERVIRESCFSRSNGFFVYGEIHSQG